MSATITGKLNKPANQFQAGESIGFGIRLGVKYRDPKTKADEWTNYQAVIFAKAPAQVAFYQQALVEGTVVQVFAEKLAIKSFDGQNGQLLSIDMLNARIGFVYTGEAPQQPQNSAAYASPPQPNQPSAGPPGYRQGQAQGASQSQPQPSCDFDDDIPF
jgi:single-strand DNA-binding protein